MQVGYLAGAHGSALVEAGAGQALAAVTVGNRFEMQEVQSLLGVEQQSLFVHTAQPAFAQNQVRASVLIVHTRCSTRSPRTIRLSTRFPRTRCVPQCSLTTRLSPRLPGTTGVPQS